MPMDGMDRGRLVPRLILGDRVRILTTPLAYRQHRGQVYGTVPPVFGGRYFNVAEDDYSFTYEEVEVVG